MRRFLTTMAFCAAVLCAGQPTQGTPPKISGTAFSRVNVSVHQDGVADARRKIDARTAPPLPRKSLGSWAIAGPAAVFLFYLIAWFSLGPEPKPGALVARYEPPEGLSPAAVRYIVSGTTDGRSFTGLLVRRDEKEVVLRDGQNKEIRLAAKDVEVLQPSRLSLMPDGQLAGLTAQQAADLLEYLASRK